MQNKLFFIIPSLKKGGAERFMSNLVNSIQIDGIIHLIILNSNDIRYEILPRKNLKIEYYNYKKVIYSLPLIAKRILTEKPSIVFTTLGNLNLYTCILKTFLPVDFKLVIRPILLAIHEKKSGIVSNINFQINKAFLSHADLVICQSKDMRDDYLSCYPKLKSKSVIINNMFDPKIRSIRLSQKNIMKPSNPVRFISVGRLEYQKGYDILIEAVSKLEELNFVLQIFGSGSLHSELNNKIFDLGLENKVKLMGSTDNVYEELINSDYFILSSRFEGFPNVLVEALALGIPSIVLPSPGGITEIMDNVTHSGVTAKNSTATELYKSILYILNNSYIPVPIEETEKYNSFNISNQYKYLFEDLLRRKIKYKAN